MCSDRSRLGGSADEGEKRDKNREKGDKDVPGSLAIRVSLGW
jgi:hypothetical protein